MNLPLVFYIIGWCLNIEAAFMAPAIPVSFLYHEDCRAVLFSTLLCLTSGVFLTFRKPANRNFTLNEGYVSAALTWIVMSLTGLLPYLFSGAIARCCSLCRYP